MIPVSLTIKGLYSYQHEQIIDFTKLTDSHIFGIFGTVGSGKSSILEAISFALYGETERLNSGDSRNYNMLNLKSNELLIDFTFINHDKGLYRFVVTARRNGKNFEKVGAYSRMAYKFEGIWQPLDVNKADSIIGLSYDNFRRTIIIPQGQFQEFLQLGDKDRTNMLKEIFNLEKYDFSDQVSSLFRKNEDALLELSGRMSQLGAVSEDVLLEEATILTALNQEYNANGLIYEALQKEVQEMTLLKNKFEERASKIKILTNLEKRQNEMTILKVKLAKYEYALLNFKDLIHREKQLNTNLNKKQSEQKIVEDKVNDMLHALKKDQLIFVRVSQEFNELELRKKEKSDFESLLVIRKKQENLDKKNMLLSKIISELEKIDSEKTSLNRIVSQEKEAIEKVKEKLAQFNDWANVQSWYLKEELLKNQSLDTQKSLHSLDALIENTTIERTKLVSFDLEKKISATNSPSLLSLKSELEKIEQANNELQKDLQLKLEKLQVQAQLSAFTSQIHTGEPCPLCGSHEHPNILHVEEVSQEIESCRKRKLELDLESKELRESLKRVDLALAEVSNLTKQKYETLEKHQFIEAALKAHSTLFIWEQFSSKNKEGFFQAQNEANENQQKLHILETQFKQSEAALHAVMVRFDLGKEHFQANQTEITILENELQQLKNQLLVLEENSLEFTEETLNHKLNWLNAHIEQTTLEYKELNHKIQKNQIILASAESEQLGLQKALVELAEELESIQKRFELQLEISTLSNRDEVELILLENLNLEENRALIATFEQELFSVKQSLDSLNESLSGLTWDETAYQESQFKITQKKEEFEQLYNRLIEKQTILNNLQAQWETKKEFQTRLNSLENRKENLKLMLNLFKSNGFVNYISSVYLQQLCEAANERFYKMTRQQLRLEIAENNSFQVRDYLNEGRVRSVKTLSGGQTFQASLCLALALAESIPNQSKAEQNFFFLDEGFGSQDKESLRIVFESLKALRQENRIVGIISHVEEMQQEIDCHITVEKSIEFGSVVHRSWQ